MRQVLFRIPLRDLAQWLPAWVPESIPIYGFGVMLFFAFVLSTWLAIVRARRRGISNDVIYDLAMYLFVGGLIGARLTYMIQYKRPLSEFLYIWEGGIVFYGSVVGGFVGFLAAYHFVFKKHNASWWTVADVIAPSAALGLAIGRFGCFLNGCCFGAVACVDCPAVHFPLSAPARYELVGHGYQTAAGFTMDPMNRPDPRTVAAVDPASPAYANGLRAGDVIVEADGRAIQTYDDLQSYLAVPNFWPRGKNDLSLVVERDGKRVEVPAFVPLTLGLHPTQLYESISMLLLMLLLLAFEPFRPHDGWVMVLFFLCYPVHRFLNEILRNDTDPVAFDMTLSQNGSLLIFTAGLVMAAWIELQARLKASRAAARVPALKG